MSSPRVFLIAPPFNPICFAQSPPLFSYIGGPKVEALHLSIESSIGGGGASWTNRNSYNIFHSLWLGALKGGGEAPANHELSNQTLVDTHYFI